MSNSKIKSKYQLHHPKHTGKLLHHRQTHYPALLFIMLVALVAGALIFMTGRIARADNLYVSAIVPAPIPAGTPAFTAPADGTTLTEPTVRFTGTCPTITPAVIIALYEGSSLLGSGACRPNGTFEVSVTLTPGSHAIIARVVTITNQSGQSSAPIHIIYTVPPAPATAGTSPQSSANAPPQPTVPSTSAAAAPLDIISEQAFLTYARTISAEWRGRFAGGALPYRITIDWGDGSRETHLVTSSDLQAYRHPYRGSAPRTLIITIEDDQATKLTREYAVQYVGIAPRSDTGNIITGLIDGYPIDPFMSGIMIYLCMLMAMLLMWRYEHNHFPRRVIGVPLHYHWQKPVKNKHSR